MRTSVSDLIARPLTEEEALTVVGSEQKREIITWLALQMKDLNIGQGVEIGPFESPNDAKNFNGYYVGKTARYLKWGLDEKGQPTEKARSKGQVREREKKFYLWIVRKA